MGVTPPSTCPRVDHLVSRLPPVTVAPYSDSLSLRLRRSCALTLPPLFGVLFTFPSRYWFAIGLSVVFSLAGWSPRIHAEFLVFRTTQVPPRLRTRFRVRVFHPLRKCFPALSPNLCGCLCRRSYNPGRCVATPPVWAPALSLATTRAITVVFFSSGYLDVSVPRVGPWLGQVAEVRSAGLPHSDIRASTGICP